VGVRPRTDRQTDRHTHTHTHTHTQTRVTIVYFASSTTHTKCNEPCLHEINKSSAVAEMGDRLANRPKSGGLMCPFPWGAGSPSNTMSPGPRPTSVPSGILIHPTVWPPTYTDRQTGQRRQLQSWSQTCSGLEFGLSSSSLAAS